MIIHPLDNVEIRDDGHKYALRAIRAGENVIKYGMPIGHATRDIAPGEHVHVHNVATNLGDNLEYAYEPDPEVVRSEGDSKRTTTSGEVPTFKGYRHPDGRVGVRNDIWVVPTVGCVNNLCERLAASCGGIALTPLRLFAARRGPRDDGEPARRALPPPERGRRARGGARLREQHA